MLRRRNRKLNNKRVRRHFPVAVLLLLLLVLAVLIYACRPKLWNSKEKLIMATHGRNGNVTVSVMDPAGGTRSDIIIPGNLQVQVAGELGTWKLSSIWQLGVNEKKGGNLLAKTIVKNFGFPVVAWKDEETQKSNLSLGDKLRLWIFNLRVRGNSIYEVDLSQTAFLKKTRFLDGESGYVVSGALPLEISALFFDDEISKGNLKARIVNFSNNSLVAEKLGQVIEIMGVKIASIEKRESADFDCNLSGSNIRLIDKLDLIFDCSNNSSEESGGYDVSLEIGKGFIRRF